MIYMLRKGIKFSIQRVYFPQSYFESNTMVNVLIALENSNR